MLNFAIGPVMVEPEILKIGSEQIPYFRTQEFSDIMLENEALIKKLMNANDSSRVLFLTASGTAAMEAAVINTLNHADKIIVVNGGSFGERFKLICDAHGLNATEIKLDYGQSLTKDHLAPFENRGYSAFLINVHETSTGVLYDLKLVKEFCRRNRVFLIVDAISSFLADPYDMHGVNTTIISSQKGLALPPGLSMIVVDEGAQERIAQNKSSTFYFDLKQYLSDGERGQTPFTPAVGILLQLRKRLEAIDSVGVRQIVDSVGNLALHFRSRITSVGLPFEIPYKSLSNALTPLTPHGKMKAYEIFQYLKDKKDIFVCPNGGELQHTLFRVGHIGALSIADNETLVQAFCDMKSEGIL